MSGQNDNTKVLLNILMKEYEILRSEVRLYIDKMYLAVTIILAILTFGIINHSPEESGLVYVFIPFIISLLFGYFATASFFVNKTAGYVSLIERRINRIFNTQPYWHENGQRSLAPLQWECFYADLSLNRDGGGLISGAFKYAIFVLAVPALILIGSVIWIGILWINNQWGCVLLGVVYGVISVVLLFGSCFLFARMIVVVRKQIKSTNDDLLKVGEPI